MSLDSVILKNVFIPPGSFRNFQGKGGRYNPEGNRNFVVFLDKKIAENMLRDGWNVKYLESREEGDEPQAIIKVVVRYDPKPPKVTMVTSRNHTRLDEDTIGELDHVDFKTCDIILNPYTWTVGENVGVKAYLQTGYFTIDEDPLELEYNALFDDRNQTHEPS